MKIKIAINPNHTNKMPQLAGDEMRQWWRGFNGGFHNVDIPIDKFIDAVQSGYSYTAQHAGYRKADNFLRGQHIGLDFDTGDERSSIDNLASNEFIMSYASFIHTTPSHTEQNPRARVIFVLPFAFRRVSKYSAITEAFAHKFGSSDPSCSDPVRLFFGAKDCEVRLLGNTIPLDVVTEIVLKYKETQRRIVEDRPEQITINGSISRIWSGMLDSLRSVPDGQKWYQLGRTSRAAGGYVSAGYISEIEAFDGLMNAIANRAKDTTVAEERIKWGLTVGKSEPIYLEEDLDPIMQSVLR